MSNKNPNTELEINVGGTTQLWMIKYVTNSTQIHINTQIQKYTIKQIQKTSNAYVKVSNQATS